MKQTPVIVTVSGDNIEDTRIFSKIGKLRSYLKMVKEHYPKSKTIIKPCLNLN